MTRTANVEIEEGGPQLCCFCPPAVAIHIGDSCIVEVDKVLEFGRVTSIDESETSDRIDKSIMIVRQATLRDQAAVVENSLRSKMAKDSCTQAAEKHGLEIRFVRVRYNFDRTVLRVLFGSDQNVDTRDMVKELANELHTLLDMKQIGVRDEAGFIGGMGPCGRQMCCCSWLKDFESVNVKMAKAQRLSLNPSAISGNCGRLKCCLRYEYDLYKEMGRHLPRQGACVKCPNGKGWVVGRNILAQKIRVSLEDERIAEFDASEVTETWHRRANSKGVDDEDTRT